LKITCAWQLYGLSSRNGHQYPSITTTQDQSFEDNLCWTVLCVEPYRNCHLYPGSIICRLPALDSSVLSTIGTVTCIQDQSFVDYLCWTVLCVEPYRNCHLYQDQSFVDYLGWTVLCVEPYRTCAGQFCVLSPIGTVTCIQDQSLFCRLPVLDSSVC
jgi:hypothetical protein